MLSVQVFLCIYPTLCIFYLQINTSGCLFFKRLLPVVLLSSPEHGAEQTMHCYPSSIPCIQSVSWCGSCDCTLLLCLSLQSVCCPEAFAQNKPPHFCWLTLQAMSADFVSQHSRAQQASRMVGPRGPCT